MRRSKRSRLDREVGTRSDAEIGNAERFLIEQEESKTLSEHWTIPFLLKATLGVLVCMHCSNVGVVTHIGMGAAYYNMKQSATRHLEFACKGDRMSYVFHM